jgi:hypothetical protein
VGCLFASGDRAQIGPMQFVIATLISIWPMAAPAQELSPAQVHSAFAEAGFAVDAPSAFASNVTSIAIHDPARERSGWPLLRAFVYADSAAAEQARASEQLLAGYGAPTWQGNIALMQLSQDPAAFPQEVNCAPVPVSSTPTALSSVDPTFASMLSGPMARLHSAE